MILNPSPAETADKDKQKFFEDLSKYKLDEKQIKIIEYMSKSMKDYNIWFIGLGIILSIFLLSSAFDEENPFERVFKLKTLFKLVVALIQAIVVIFVFWRTRKTALSFQSIAQKKSLSELRTALDNLKKLYNLECIVVVLILILIPGKTLIDLISYIISVFLNIHWLSNK